jgi:probable phosphoglycerate mutase
VREVWLVRHAEAAAASGNPGLSVRGRDQACALARRAADAGVREVLHGPRLRAAETAALVAGALDGVEARVCADLEDRTPVPAPGRRAGFTPRQLEWLEAVPPDERDDEGASLSASFDRLVRRALPSEGPLVLVTHAFVIAWWCHLVRGGPTASWMGLAPANAGVTVVRVRGDRPRLVQVDDTSHLA